MAALLDVKNLKVDYGHPAAPIRVLRDISFRIERNEIVGVVGESGSGKSTLCAAAIRALSGKPRVSGQVMFDGKDVYGLSRAELAQLYGRRIGMVRQNPMSSLDPFWTVGNQLCEVLARRGVPRQRRYGEAVAALKRVMLTAPEVRMGQFPHQLSGGMLQRTLIAMATYSSPDLLIADEPTSALDASIRDEILLLFKDLRENFGTTVMLITHELEVVRRICDRVMVMYAGEVVEEGPVADIFARPTHPYTRALMAATPRIHEDEVVMTPIPGQVPMLSRTVQGCSFADRCAEVRACCRTAPPPRRSRGLMQQVKCHLEEAGHVV